MLDDAELDATIDELHSRLKESQFARNHSSQSGSSGMSVDEHYRTWDMMWRLILAKNKKAES